MTPSAKAERAAKARLREAEETGCHGLLRGIARSLRTDEAWEAEIAHRDYGPFYCPSCFSDVVLRKCAEKVDHFAHKSRLSPVLGPKEMLLHNACTAEICMALEGRFPEGKWAVQRRIPENRILKIPTLEPDISGRMGGTRVAIEVQISALTVPRIVQRTRDYARRGIALVWIVPLSQPLGNEPFRPRLYERYLHSIFYGRTYYWWSGQGLTVKPVHYGPATRHIEYRECHDNGQLESAGGYNAAYKTIKTPEYGRDLNLCDDFFADSRATFTPENEKKKVPACLRKVCTTPTKTGIDAQHFN